MGEVEKAVDETIQKDGNVDIDVDELDATWGDVYTACCVKTPAEWGKVFLSVLAAVFFLYFFLVGLDFLGTGAKVMSGCAAGGLFGNDANPVAGLMIGIICTVLLQSSSTTTSLVVSLVGSDVVSVRQGIFFIMGANIGTTVTNTLVSLGHLGDGEELERAFAGATVHDMFNYLTVIVLFPIELATGYLRHLTAALVKNYQSKEGEEWEGPISKYVEPIGFYVLIENKDVPKALSKGGSCDEFYPIVCIDNDNPSYEGCNKDACEGCHFGLIKCDEDHGCPAFFDVNATRSDDVMSGAVVFVIGIAMLFICLFALVKVLQSLIMTASSKVVYKATNVHPILAILIGMGLTVAVQSSSVVTSTLTPLCGLGILRLEQMFPLTLGSNIGTTITGIMAALLSDAKAMQVALAHTFFNVTGILIWYPIPYLRAVPLNLARGLGRGTRLWRGFPFLYIAIAFFAVPFLLLGLSTMFTQDSKGLTIMGVLVVLVLLIVFAWTGYYMKYQGGTEKCYESMKKRQVKREVFERLPEDMEWLKAKVKELSEHTGLDRDEEEQGSPMAHDVEEDA